MKFSSRKAVVAALASMSVLAASACTSQATADNGKPGASASGSQTGSPSESPSPSPTVDPVAWTSNVSEDATGVAVNTRVTAAADAGDLTQAALSYVSKKGNTVEVKGKLAAGTWTAGDLLEPGVKYSLALSAKNSSGETEKVTRTFRTANLTLDDQIYVAVSPGDGADVGIGMPVIVRFDLPVTDKAAFEKHMAVTSSPAQAGSWYWLSSREAHWRPKSYWKPGTKVNVKAELNGVQSGKLYGEMSRTSSFSIGRSVMTIRKPCWPCSASARRWSSC
ncbi:MAG: Ig-like domain-containing protein, partial [Terracoccus sp.]